MKRLLIMMLILFLTCPAYAGLPSYLDNKNVDKFKRGVVNVLTAVFEIPHTTKNSLNEAEAKPVQKGAYFIKGLFLGVQRTVFRMGSGLYDMATFNLDKPAEFQPLMKPDYVWGDEK